MTSEITEFWTRARPYTLARTIVKMVGRAFNVVIWGANGFTGKLVCRHAALDYQVGPCLPICSGLFKSIPAYWSVEEHYTFMENLVLFSHALLLG